MACWNEGASRDFSLPEKQASPQNQQSRMQPPPSQRNATYQATNLQVEERILERWDKKIHGDRLKTKHSGCYYMFESLDGSISVEGGDDMTGSSSDIEADTPCIVL